MTDASTIPQANADGLTLAGILRQTGHRVGSVGLLALVGALAIVFANNMSRLGMIGPTIDVKRSAWSALLLTGFLACDVALVASVAAWWVDTQWRKNSRETIGLIAFNLIVMLVSLILFIMSRSTALDRTIASILRAFL